jgi:hypothetical protein
VGDGPLNFRSIEIPVILNRENATILNVQFPFIADDEWLKSRGIEVPMVLSGIFVVRSKAATDEDDRPTVGVTT